MNTAYISLGGNQGREEVLFSRALSMLEDSGARISAQSPIYRTEPQGFTDQPWFRNQVAQVNWDDNAYSLLKIMQGVEKDLGRVRGQGHQFGPRPIDLDLLLFQGIVQSEPELILPHPRMRQRAFVLIPLLDIAPNLAFPDGGTVREALDALSCRLDGDAIYQGV